MKLWKGWLKHLLDVLLWKYHMKSTKTLITTIRFQHLRGFLPVAQPWALQSLTQFSHLSPSGLPRCNFRIKRWCLTMLLFSLQKNTYILASLVWDPWVWVTWTTCNPFSAFSRGAIPSSTFTRITIPSITITLPTTTCYRKSLAYFRFILV